MMKKTILGLSPALPGLGVVDKTKPLASPAP